MRFLLFLSFWCNIVFFVFCFFVSLFSFYLLAWREMRPQGSAPRCKRVFRVAQDTAVEDEVGFVAHAVAAYVDPLVAPGDKQMEVLGE